MNQLLPLCTCAWLFGLLPVACRSLPLSLARRAHDWRGLTYSSTSVIPLPLHLCVCVCVCVCVRVCARAPRHSATTPRARGQRASLRKSRTLSVKGERRPVKIKVFANGNEHFNGMMIPVDKGRLLTLGHLIEFVQPKLERAANVHVIKRIYDLGTGAVVSSIDGIEDGNRCVTFWCILVALFACLRERRGEYVCCNAPPPPHTHTHLTPIPTSFHPQSHASRQIRRGGSRATSQHQL
jgi:hypothetical protein